MNISNFKQNIDVIETNEFIYKNHVLTIKDGVESFKLSTIIPYGINEKVKEIYFPNSLRVIESEESTLNKLINLEKVHFNEGLQFIGDYVFSKSNLKEIKMPSSLLAIGVSAFSNCKNLQKVELNDSLKYLGSCAFVYSSINELEIPKGLTLMGLDIVSCCENLKNFHVYEGIRYNFYDQLIRDENEYIDLDIIMNLIDYIEGYYETPINLSEFDANLYDMKIEHLFNDCVSEIYNTRYNSLFAFSYNCLDKCNELEDSLEKTQGELYVEKVEGDLLFLNNGIVYDTQRCIITEDRKSNPTDKIEIER